MSSPLLSVEELTVTLRTQGGDVRALDRISFDVAEGEILGVVGESGSGKTVTAMTILGLLPKQILHVEHGRICFEGRDLLALSDRDLSALRGRKISMVFQSPGTSLNPLRRIGDQLREVLALHRGLRDRAADAEARVLMDLVGLPNRVLRNYPHELSGGMQQRSYLAIAIAPHPALLIADEPTSALDVSIQAQIVDLLKSFHREGFIRSIIFVTHDFGIAEELCDSVAVLYAGQMAERGPVETVLRAPRHPYARGLISAIPKVDTPMGGLQPIPGTVPNLIDPPNGCRFNARCPKAMDRCAREMSKQTQIDPRHNVWCQLYEDDEFGGSQRHAG